MKKKTSSLDNMASVAAQIPGIDSNLIKDINSKEKDSDSLLHPAIKEQLLESSDRDFNLIVIGTGPAGYVAAIRAAQLGMKVGIIEKGAVGGVCLNVGCIPTKAILSCVEVLEHIRTSDDFGIYVSDCGVDVAKIMARKNKIVKQLTSGVGGLIKKNGIKLIKGEAYFEDSHTIAVKTASDVKNYSADKIIIATGSVPATIPIPGLELSEKVWTSNEALEFTTIPKSLLIIGAGAIGLEFGYTFAKLGTQVIMVEMMPQIIPSADTESANELQKSLKNAGIEILTSSTVIGASDTKTGKKVTIKTAEGEITRDVEKVLVAVGRKAQFDNIQIEKAGVKADKRKILVDEHMQTNMPHIFAIGDVVGEPMLAHIGWAEAVVAVEYMMGMNVKMDYKTFPACVYTSPEFACVGMTEEQARERYSDIKVGKFTFAFNAKAMGIGEAIGFVKFIIEPKYERILGIHIVGPHATDLIAEAVLAIKNELTVEEVIAAIHPHPTLSETMQEAALDSLGKAIHK